ncbi:MAG: cytochrome c [Gemmatimonadaceae bacterium]
MISHACTPFRYFTNGIAAKACAAVVATFMIVACSKGAETSRSGANGDVVLPSAGQLASIPLGDVAGAAPNNGGSTIPNPYHNDAGATEEGRVLFERMNCAACHGYTLGGGMGPNLADTYWRYGGAPAQIYNSIFQGRPRGMPAWGAALSSAEIWKITAYIEAHGGAFPAAQADQGRQGNRGDQKTDAASSLKGLHDAN